MTLGEVQTLVTIAVALGLREGAAALWRYLTGRSEQERSRVKQLRDERDAAEDDRDREAACRRKLQEHAALVRSRALIAGVPPDALPDYPACP